MTKSSKLFAGLLMGFGISLLSGCKDESSSVAGARSLPIAQVVPSKEDHAKERFLAALKSSMLDEDAAKIRGVKVGKLENKDGSPGDLAICGEANGKNRFGGYVGFKGFVVTDSKSGTPVIFWQGGDLNYFWGVYSTELGCTKL